MEWHRCAVVCRQQQRACGASVHGHASPHTKLYTRAPTAAPLNHPSRGPIHLLLVDWDPITIPNRARMKEWQTACEETNSRGRLMGQILGWFMRHPTSLHTYHQESLMPYATKKQAFHHTPCIIPPFVALHFEKSPFYQEYIYIFFIFNQFCVLMSYQSCSYLKCCKTFSLPYRHAERTYAVRSIATADKKCKDSEFEKEENKPFDYHWFVLCFFFLAGYQGSY